MIIDLICERMDGNKYNPRDFYFFVLAYPGGINISRAMDEGTEENVKKELCRYIEGNKYNNEIKDYINSVSWLEADDK